MICLNPIGSLIDGILPRLHMIGRAQTIHEDQRAGLLRSGDDLGLKVIRVESQHLGGAVD